MTRRKIANTEIESFENEIDYHLYRPYSIGSVERRTETKIVIENDKFVSKEFTLIPGLFQIVEEVIANAVDECIKTGFGKNIIIPKRGVPRNKNLGNKIEVFFDRNNIIIVQDNGRGIPQNFDKQTGKYIPELVFCNLRTGSNFDDTKGIELLGKNGVGVSFTNIFSQTFMVDTTNGNYLYHQRFQNNSKDIDPPFRRRSKDTTGTEIRFLPDYEYFKSINSDVMRDLPKLIERRLNYLSFIFPKITFKYNHLSVQTIFTTDSFEKSGAILVEEEKVRLGLRLDSEDFVSVSFVNGIETKGGTHVNYIVDKVVEYTREYIKKKYKITVRPNEIKSKLFLLLSLHFPNPDFETQTKDVLVSPENLFSDKIDEVLTERVLSKIVKNEKFIESIVEIYVLKLEAKERKEIKQLSKKRKTKIAKLIEAQSKDTEKNILMIAEGNSALNELINVRNEHTAGIPIRGKILNVYEKSVKDIVANVELNSLMQAIGLTIDKKADNINYGRIGFLVDMDHDGNSIAGLLINFFYKFWPELFEQKKIVRVLSPLYTAEKSKEILRFYTYTEYKQWDKTKKGKWVVKYHKGLGSLESTEYDLVLNKPEYIEITVGQQTDDMLKLVYSGDSDARKIWLGEVK